VLVWCYDGVCCVTHCATLDLHVIGNLRRGSAEDFIPRDCRVHSISILGLSYCKLSTPGVLHVSLDEYGGIVW